MAGAFTVKLTIGAARRGLQIMAAAATVAAAASCSLYVNDDGSLALPANALANPSYNSVTSTVGVDGVEVGSELEGVLALLCGVTTPAGNASDIVLQAPHGQSVLLTSGFQSSDPTNVIALPDALIRVILGGIGPFGPVVLTPAAVHRHGGFFVPKSKQARVLRIIARHAHIPGARSVL